MVQVCEARSRTYRSVPPRRASLVGGTYVSSGMLFVSPMRPQLSTRSSPRLPCRTIANPLGIPVALF
jgi:hypothetical protein